MSGYCHNAYQTITKQASGFPLKTGINGLEVKYKLGREVAAEMSVVGFEAPVLNRRQETRVMRKMGEWMICDGDDPAGRVTASEY